MCVDTNIDADRLHIKSLAAQTHLVRLYHSCAFLLAIFDDAFVSHLSRVWACAADFARRNLLGRLGGGLVCRDSIRGIHHGGVATEAVLVGGHVFRLVLLEVGRVWWRRALGLWHFGSVQESTSRTWTLPARRLVPLFFNCFPGPGTPQARTPLVRVRRRSLGPLHLRPTDIIIGKCKALNRSSPRAPHPSPAPPSRHTRAPPSRPASPYHHAALSPSPTRHRSATCLRCRSSNPPPSLARRPSLCGCGCAWTQRRRRSRSAFALCTAAVWLLMWSSYRAAGCRFVSSPIQSVRMAARR